MAQHILLIMEFLDEKIQRLYREGYKQKEIARKVGFSQAHVSRLMRKFGMKTKGHSERHRKPIDLTPSPNLAYIVGALKGDGDIINNPKWRKYGLRLRVSSKIFAQSFRKALQKQGLEPYMWFTENPHKGIWNVTADSQEFIIWYENLNLTEFLTTKEMQISFLKGIYEAEGGYYYSSYASIFNTDSALISLIESILFHDLGFVPSVYCSKKGRKKPRYQIYIPTKETARFLALIKPCIKN